MGIDVETWRARIGLYHAASVGRHLKKQHKAAGRGRSARMSQSRSGAFEGTLDTLLHILVTCLLALLYTDLHFVFPYLSKATKFHNFDQKVLGFVSSGMNACRGVMMKGLALPKSTLVALSLLLIISGDVELNPGPVEELNIKNLKNALSKVQSKWYDIGIQLEIDVPVLKRIENDYRRQSRQLSEMLSHWLDGNAETQVTWETIIDALESSSVNEKGLATEIKTRYCQSTDNASQGFTADLNLRLKNLTNALSTVQSKWYEIGVQLNIDPATLQEFQVNNKPHGCGRNLSSVLIFWLNKNTDMSPTWQTIMSVLQTSAVNENKLADEIRSRYCTCQGNGSYRTQSSQEHYFNESNTVTEPQALCAQGKFSEEYDQAGTRAKKPKLHNSLSVTSDTPRPVSLDAHLPDDLHLAIHHYCKQEKVFKCLEEGLKSLVTSKKADTSCEDGFTPMHLACKLGSLSAVCILVREMKKNHTLNDVLTTYANDNGMTPLNFAARGGHLDIVKYLIEEQKCNRTVKTKTGNTPLHNAAQFGHIEVVKYFVETHHCNPFQKGFEDAIPLHLACKNGHLEVVKYLLNGELLKEHDILIKEILEIQRDKYNCAPIHLATYYNHFDVVKYLIEDMKCDPNIATTELQMTCLHFASRAGYLRLVKYLVIEQKCDPLVKNTRGNNGLHLAAREGNISVVKFFFKTGCYPGDDQGLTPLNFAARGGHLDTVKYLIQEQKCDPKAQSKTGNTPLHNAAQFGRLETVKYLIEEQQCDPMVKTKDNNTPLHNAAQFGHLEVVTYLVEEQQCNPFQKGFEDAIPLHLACKNGHLEVVKYLLNGELLKEHGIVIEEILEIQREKYGCAPIHLATYYNHFDVVKYLIKDMKCDPNVTTTALQMTPLHFASREGDLPLVKYLVTEQNCNPLLKNTRGNNSLHLAAREGNISVVKFFIETCKCSPHTEGQQGHTPLELARIRDHKEVVEYLEQY